MQKAVFFCILCLICLLFITFFDNVVQQPASAGIAVEQLSDGYGSMNTRIWHTFSSNIVTVITGFLFLVFAILFGGDIYKSLANANSTSSS